MGAAYFIVLDKADIDAFVNGKAIAREARRLTRVAMSIGLRPIDDFVSFNGDEFETSVEEFRVEGVITLTNQQWFTPEEGLAWVDAMCEHIKSNPKAVKDPEGILSDLGEYERVLHLAKDAQSRWHLSVDY